MLNRSRHKCDVLVRPENTHTLPCSIASCSALKSIGVGGEEGLPLGRYTAFANIQLFLELDDSYYRSELTLRRQNEQCKCTNISVNGRSLTLPAYNRTTEPVEALSFLIPAKIHFVIVFIFSAVFVYIIDVSTNEKRFPLQFVNSEKSFVSQSTRGSCNSICFFGQLPPPTHTQRCHLDIYELRTKDRTSLRVPDQMIKAGRGEICFCAFTHLVMYEANVLRKSETI